MHDEDTGPQFSHFGMFVTDLEKSPASIVTRWTSSKPIAETWEIGGSSSSAAIRASITSLLSSRAAESPRGEVVNQLSFRLPTLAARKRYVARALVNGATDLRTISHGNAWAAYFRDPEGNRAELFVDSPWYVAQPWREPLDLERLEAETMAATEAWCRAQPSFRPAADFQADFAAKLASQLARS